MLINVHCKAVFGLHYLYLILFLGMAIEDVVAAKMVYDKYERQLGGGPNGK